MIKMSHDRKINNYWKLASVCKTDEDKINFFDLYPDAFELDSNQGEEFASAMSYFQKEWETDPYQYKEQHGDYPAEFKVYAFENVIMRGTAYSKHSGLYD